MHIANALVAAVVLVGFACLAAREARSVRSPRDFFHHPRLRSNVISLTAANITLGSGVAYLITGGYQHGALMFLAHAGLLAGYLLMARILSRPPAPIIREAGNYLAGIDRAISQQTGRRSWFGPIVVVSLCVAYLLVLAFEVYAASVFMAPLFVENPDRLGQALIATVLFAVTLFYSLAGGIRGVFKTDKLQLIAAVVLIGCIVYAALAPPPGHRFAPPRVRLVLDWTTLLVALNAMVVAAATQFYSILNWAYVSHVEAEAQARLLRRVGVLSAILLALVLAAGVMMPDVPSDSPPAQWLLSRYLGLIAGAGSAKALLTAILVIGCMSVVISTIDSLLLSITMFGCDLWGLDTKSEQPDARALRQVRGLAGGGLVVAFLAMLLFQVLRPNLFYLLLSIASGLLVYAPLLASSAAWSYTPPKLKALGRGALAGYFALYIAVLGASVAAALRYPDMVAWCGLGGLLASVLWTNVLKRRG